MRGQDQSQKDNSYDPEESGDTRGRENNQKQKRQFYKKPSIHGNINDLVSKRMGGKLSHKPTMRRRNVGGNNQDPAEGIYSEFVPDIDNFEGVKEIKNYCIVSLKDNGYSLGEQSVGVLQLFNKLDGTKQIEKEDLARIQCVSRFLGALVVKAQSFTNSLTLVIGMTICLKESNF